MWNILYFLLIICGFLILLSWRNYKKTQKNDYQDRVDIWDFFIPTTLKTLGLTALGGVALLTASYKPNYINYIILAELVIIAIFLIAEILKLNTKRTVLKKALAKEKQLAIDTKEQEKIDKKLKAEKQQAQLKAQVVAKENLENWFIDNEKMFKKLLTKVKKSELKTYKENIKGLGQGSFELKAEMLALVTKYKKRIQKKKDTNERIKNL